MNDILPTLFVAWIAIATGAISSGPSMVAIVSRGLGSGVRAALTVAFGIALGGFGWALLTMLGLGVLFIIYGGYGLLFSANSIQRLYRRFQKISEASFGTIFGLIGIGMIVRSLSGE